MRQLGYEKPNKKLCIKYSVLSFHVMWHYLEKHVNCKTCSILCLTGSSCNEIFNLFQKEILYGNFIQCGKRLLSQSISRTHFQWKIIIPVTRMF
jgi:hypothetical protein